MKSRLTIIYFLTTSLCSWGQVVKLETSNPAPRVGDRISISFTLGKNNLDSMEIADDIHSRSLVESMNQIGDGRIEISEWFLTDTGPLKIGPLQIPINSKTYVTSELNMTVSPKLPDDINEGVWIRLITFQNEEYIILEQRVPGQMKPKVNSSGRTIYSMGTEGVDFAAINEDTYYRQGFPVTNRGSWTAIQPIAIGDALYKITVYTYKLPNDFKGEFKIEKRHLIYLPDKGHFEIKRVKN